MDTFEIQTIFFFILNCKNSAPKFIYLFTFERKKKSTNSWHILITASWITREFSEWIVESIIFESKQVHDCKFYRQKKQNWIILSEVTYSKNRKFCFQVLRHTRPCTSIFRNSTPQDLSSSTNEKKEDLFPFTNQVENVGLYWMWLESY